MHPPCQYTILFIQSISFHLLFLNLKRILFFIDIREEISECVAIRDPDHLCVSITAIRMSFFYCVREKVICCGFSSENDSCNLPIGGRFSQRTPGFLSGFLLEFLPRFHSKVCLELLPKFIERTLPDIPGVSSFSQPISEIHPKFSSRISRKAASLISPRYFSHSFPRNLYRNFPTALQHLVPFPVFQVCLRCFQRISQISSDFYEVASRLSL